MKIVIAIDSFKGCLNSFELGKAAEEGFRDICPACSTIVLPIADGGEGTAAALTQACQGQTVSLPVHDPLGRTTQASYGIMANRQTAIIEMASASGLSLIPYQEGNVMRTSTYGTGEMIRDAIGRGCREIILGIGGSATNDAGTGMLQALGFVFKDSKGNKLNMTGSQLTDIDIIDTTAVLPELASCQFQVATDVTNPFYGSNGAACIFAPQKGATPEMVVQLDKGLRHFARLVEEIKGIDLQQIPGSGAAGGLGGACHAFLQANLSSGIELVLQALQFDRHIQQADLIITGEGKIDSQTRQGKVVSGIIRHARKYNIPVIAFTGNNEDADPSLYKEGLTAAWSIHPAPVSLQEALNPEYARKNIRQLAQQTARFFQAMRTRPSV